MADKEHIELFIERFIEYNLVRYKDNPKMLVKFEGLTSEMVTVSDIQPIMEGSRRNSAVFSAPRRFKGINQSWTPAKAETDLKLYKPVTEEPLASKAKLAEIVEQGVYFYVDGQEVKVAIVIANGIDVALQPAAVESTLRAALVYDIPKVAVPGTGNTCILTGNTFEGTLYWVEGQAPIEVIPETDYGQLKGKKP